MTFQIKRVYEPAAALEELRKLGQKKTVTLLYGAHDPAINHAVVLLSALRK